jgi:hypothetical protein
MTQLNANFQVQPIGQLSNFPFNLQQMAQKFDQPIQDIVFD